MKECVCLLLFMFLITEGCDVSDHKQIKAVTGYTGGSVLLPCSCVHPQSKPQTFSWSYTKDLGSKWTDVFKDEKYKDRLNLFNQTSPANLSLLISDLKEEDKGGYRCETSQTFTDIALTTKDHGKSKAVTGYTGGSVLLPCSCVHNRSKPQTFSWSYTNDLGKTWTKVFEDEKYEERLKLFNQTSPANLSLLIFDLKEEDEGSYWCQTSQTLTNIRVKIKGCDLDQNKQTLLVIGHSGESVVLPCSCTELQAKPQQLTWAFTALNPRGHPEEMYPEDQNERHRGRVKLLNEGSPGNLSLCISDLKKEDQGEYQCSVPKGQHTITLLVTEDPTTRQSEDNSKLSFFIGLSLIPVLFLLPVLALICYRYRGRRNVDKVTNDGLVVCGEKQGVVNPDGSTQEQNLRQDENEDEVTYSSVVHVKNPAKPDQIEMVMTEHSEYASIK